MKETLISFETAKLAKEKGFKTHIAYFDKAYDSDGQMIPAISIAKSPGFYQKEAYQIVSQSLLQRWLREVHEIHININTFYFEDLEKYGYEVEDIIHKDGWVVMSNTAGTYEEALEKGLQEALKLIKL